MLVDPRRLITPGLHERAIAAFPQASSHPGARALGDDGREYVSMRWPTSTDPYQWVSAADIAEDVAADVFRVNSVDKVVRYNDSAAEIEGERYQSIGKCLQYLSRFYPAYKAAWADDGERQQVNLVVIESGQSVHEQLFVDSDLGQVSIIAEDASVDLDPAGLGRLTGAPETTHAWMRVISGARAPTISVSMTLGAGSVPLDTDAVADGLVAPGYTPNPVWIETAGVVNIVGQQRDENGEVLVTERSAGVSGDFYRAVYTGIGSRTTAIHTRIATTRATGIAWFERGAGQIARSVIRGGASGHSLLCSDGQMAISTVGAGADEMNDATGGWGQDFRLIAGSDSAADIDIRNGGIVRVPVNARGGISQPPNVFGRDGAIIDARVTAAPLLEGMIAPASFTVATLPSAAANAGVQIYVTNGAAGLPIMAFSDGTNWLRCDTRTAVTAS